MSTELSNGGKAGNSQPHGVIEVGGKIAERLIGALPPAFLILILMNIGFLGMVLWFLTDVSAQRLVLVGKLLDACLIGKGGLQ